MKISCITPSVRPEMLSIIKKCLGRQLFKDFEWIIVGPKEKLGGLMQFEWSITTTLQPFPIHFIEEPEKREGDYYNLNKAWNQAFREAKGELVISIQDGLWFDPHLLDKFWVHYATNSKAIVGAIGHQYDRIEHDKPEHRIWSDPRSRADYGSFWEVNPIDVEFTIASIPLQAILDVGGFKEEFDKYAALSEKELCLRMDRLGYRFFLDNSIEYRAIKHPRLNEQWEDRYQAGCKFFDVCFKQIQQGEEVQGDL